MNFGEKNVATSNSLTDSTQLSKQDVQEEFRKSLSEILDVNKKYHLIQSFFEQEALLDLTGHERKKQELYVLHSSGHKIVMSRYFSECKKKSVEDATEENIKKVLCDTMQPIIVDLFRLSRLQIAYIENLLENMQLKLEKYLLRNEHRSVVLIKLER